MATTILPTLTLCIDWLKTFSGDKSYMLFFALGDFVIHPDQEEWGPGQVQSIVGTNVTVNFEHAGKQMINCQIIHLVRVTSHQCD